MNYKKLIKTSFQGRRSSNMTTVAIVSGLALGLAVAALFATNRGKRMRNDIADGIDGLIGRLRGKSPKENANERLGNVIDNVRGHIKKSAEGMLGPINKRANPSEIHVDSAGTLAWQNPQQVNRFPDERNPKLQD